MGQHVEKQDKYRMYWHVATDVAENADLMSMSVMRQINTTHYSETLSNGVSIFQH
jgi:hypothetical protein